jgi:hypothetical protein
MQKATQTMTNSFSRAFEMFKSLSGQLTTSISVGILSMLKTFVLSSFSERAHYPFLTETGLWENTAAGIVMNKNQQRKRPKN